MRHFSFKTVLVLFFLVLLSPFAQADYGTKQMFKKGELYYKPPVTEEQSKKLGEFLLQQKYFDDDHVRTVQLLKENDVYLVKMVMSPSAVNMSPALALIRRDILQNVFPGQKLELHITDNALKTVKVIDESSSIGDYGVELSFKKGQLFYKDPITPAEANTLGEFLLKQKFFDDDRARSVQLVKENDVYQVKMVMPKENITPQLEKSFDMILADLAKNVFASKVVELHLTDFQFTTFKKVTQK